MKVHGLLSSLGIIGLILTIGYAQTLTLDANPLSVNVLQGNIATYECEVTPDSGFSQQVFFALVDSDIPTGEASYAFTPNSIQAPYQQSVFFAVNISANLLPGSYAVRIQAGNGPVQDTLTLTLNVQTGSCQWTVDNPPGIDDQDPIRMAVGPNDVLWVSDESKLWQRQSQLWQVVNTPFSGQEARSIAIDSAGNPWVWQRGEGWYWWDGIDWTNVPPPTIDQQNTFVYDSWFDDNGILWSATYDQGLLRYDGTFWQSYTTANSDIASNEVRQMAPAPGGGFWLRTYNSNSSEEVTFFDGSMFSSPLPGCNFGYIHRIAVDASGQLWLGSNEGLFRFDGQEIEHWRGSQETPNHRILSLNCNVTLADQQSQMPNTNVYFVASDVNDIWVSSHLDFSAPPGVISRLRDGQWDSYEPATSTLPDNSLSGLARLENELVFLTINDLLVNNGYNMSFLPCVAPDTVTATSLRAPSAYEIRVYPSPAAHQITIEQTAQLPLAGQIFTASGQLIWSGTLSDRKTRLDVSSWPSGIYYLNLAGANGYQGYPLQILHP
jgi:hypothetical protein